MLKVGDEVQRKDGSTFSNGELTVTIKEINGDTVKLSTGYNLTTSMLVSTKDFKREELKKAINLIRDYGIALLHDRLPFRIVGASFESVDTLLDCMFPTESPQQLKLKELEEKACEIAKEMEQLRKSL